MNKMSMLVCLVSAANLWGAAAHADDKPGAAAGSVLESCQTDVKGDKKDEWKREPKAESSVTQHHLSSGGKTFDYTATAGTLVIRDDDDKPMANIGYIAYTRRDAPKDAGQRPLMFAFNGGPGIVVALAAHGRVGSQARDRVGSGSDPARALQDSGQ